jgi:hypothetical protein
MATSSIYADFNMCTSKKVNSFAKALNRSAHDSQNKSLAHKKSPLIQSDDIKSLWAKRKEAK